MKTPEQYHAKMHSPAVAFEVCWKCGKARAVCQRKITYATRDDAQTAANARNEAERYASPVCRYFCRWCQLWHLTHAKHPIRARRAERARRRWLIAERESQSGNGP